MLVKQLSRRLVPEDLDDDDDEDEDKQSEEEEDDDDDAEMYALERKFHRSGFIAWDLHR